MTSRDEQYETITCTLERVTAKAAAFSHDDWEKDKWVPRSLMHGGFETTLDDLDEGQEVELPVMRWFAEKEGMI